MTRNEERLQIWYRMTPEQRDYDRFAGVIPHGASWTPETEEGRKAIDERREERGLSVYEQGCSCHINPPCAYCTRISYDDSE